MLKKIPVADLRIGMYFVRVDGSWLDHGVWRGHFLVADAARLALVQASGLRNCWIDTQKGLGVEAAIAAAPRAIPRPARPALPARPATDRTCAGDDLAHAEQVCENARSAVESVFADVRRGRTPAFHAVRPVVEEIVASIFRRSAAMLAASRLKSGDDYTGAHSVSVCALMIGLGRELGFDEQRCADAGMAGLLHDVGKALLSPSILCKPGPLTDAELALVQTHPARGHEVLAESPLTVGTVLDVCLHHHEKDDGSGYPNKLASDAISVMVRMSSVCDVYDALTSCRPYKPACDPAQALAEMAATRGHFDRATLAAFVRTMGVYPVGSLVRLMSGKLAVVMENRPANLRAPLVRAFHSAKSDEPLPAHTIDLSLPSADDGIMQAELRGRWNFGCPDHAGASAAR